MRIRTPRPAGRALPARRYGASKFGNDLLGNWTFLGLSSREDRGQDIFGLVDDRVVHVEARPDERLALHVIEQLQEWVPEASDIRDHDRFRMAAELRPGELLHQLFER